MAFDHPVPTRLGTEAAQLGDGREVRPQAPSTELSTAPMSRRPAPVSVRGFPLRPGPSPSGSGWRFVALYVQLLGGAQRRPRRPSRSRSRPSDARAGLDSAAFRVSATILGVAASSPGRTVLLVGPMLIPRGVSRLDGTVAPPAGFLDGNRAYAAALCATAPLHSSPFGGSDAPMSSSASTPRPSSWASLPSPLSMTSSPLDCAPQWRLARGTARQVAAYACATVRGEPYRGTRRCRASRDHGARSEVASYGSNRREQARSAAAAPRWSAWSPSWPRRCPRPGRQPPARRLRHRIISDLDGMDAPIRLLPRRRACPG